MATTPNDPPIPANQVRLVMAIGCNLYHVTRVPCDHGSGASKCYELRKPHDGTLYHVSQHGHGHECTCPSFVFRHEGRDHVGCKHVQALVALGMFDAPGADVDPELETDPFGRVPSDSYERWSADFA